jgi:hypothetical protein
MPVWAIPPYALENAALTRLRDQKTVAHSCRHSRAPRTRLPLRGVGSAPGWVSSKAACRSLSGIFDANLPLQYRAQLPNVW